MSNLGFAWMNTVPTSYKTEMVHAIASATNTIIPTNQITGLPPDGNKKMRIVCQHKPKIARYSSKTLRSLQNGISVNGNQVAFDEAAAAAATVQIIGGRKLNDFSDEYQLSRNVRYGAPDYSLVDVWKRRVLVQVTRANRPDNLLHIAMEKVIKSTGWLEATRTNNHHCFVIVIWIPEKKVLHQVRSEILTIAEVAQQIDARFDFLFLVPKKSIAPRIFPPRFGTQRHGHDLSEDRLALARMIQYENRCCNFELPDIFEL